MKIKFVIIVLLALSPGVSYADVEFTISGANISSVNGDYEPVAANEWAITGGDAHVKAYPGYNQCWITNNSYTPLWYYTNDYTDCNDAASLAAVTTWLLDSGTNPGPTFTLPGGGGGGGGGGSEEWSSNATSSVDQVHRTFISGFYLFFASLIGMVWLLKKH